MLSGSTTPPTIPDDDLLSCLLCDAIKCTPPYVKCAGAERLRIGRESPALVGLNADLGPKSYDKAYPDDVCKLN